jgi:dipeptidase E
MKLYLSSYKVGEKSQKLFEMFGNNKNVAVIANAMDFIVDENERHISVQKELDALKQIGLEGEEVDLRDFFGKSENLATRLSNFGGVWVRGGNVFILRRAYTKSGMDNWLKSQKGNNELVYGGYSAGVCVLSPNLKGLELVDDPNKVPMGYEHEFNMEGVGLIPYAFAPHYHSPHPESEAVNGLVNFYEREGIKYKAISDGEVIITVT